ncbi:MAG: nucleotidyltransferase family protein [Polyangiaceae bacterium]|nr:nucleotidyltransferase family protein [Polyangiaceae bacterium]
MKLPRDSRELLELFNAERVDYVVVGGHAVAFHGYPRFTGDIDLLVRRGDGNADRVLRALTQFGFGSVGLDVSDFEREDNVVQLGRPPNRIDILTSISGVSFDEAWAGAVNAEMDGVPVRILGRAELIANKKASGRAKDLADVEELGE